MSGVTLLFYLGGLIIYLVCVANWWLDSVLHWYETDPLGTKPTHVRLFEWLEGKVTKP